MLPYTELRSALSDVAADVGITILDACASGAITRLKGGKPHPAFLTDASSQIKGYAFLTSSSENEAAQESERLQGSFFTQALLTGLRGAADVSGDGQVTLGEAYQFAFAETLAQTTSTQGGAQHPAYDIKMAGTGDVVLTDVRQTSATLVLGPDYDGRFVVLGPRRQLVAELVKPFGRTIELGLEPGEYEVYFEQEEKLLSSSVTVRDGQRQELIRQEMHPTRRRPTQSRGGPVELPARDPLDGRTRVQIGFGVSQISASSTVANDFVHMGHGWEGASVMYWVRPDVALALDIGVTDLTVASTPTTDRTSGTFAFLAGARYYPPLRGIVRPYASAAIGPFNEFDVVDGFAGSVGGTTGTHFGGTVGGGVDMLFGPHFTLGLDGRVALVTDRSSHFGVTMTFGWMWGGRP
jgi:Outer membrane protein beta-barrel domain